jgi:peptide deformylase
MLNIITDKTKSLRERSLPVEMPLSKRDKKILDAMLTYLKDTQDPEWRQRHPNRREGVGLAAPQIAINKRMLVIYYPAGEGEKVIEYELVNPVIAISSVQLCFLQGGEGCLSVLEPHPGRVYRPARIQVKAFEALTGKDIVINAEGYDAVVLQHEIDHLNGILFYDHIDKNDPEKVIPDAISI